MRNFDEEQIKKKVLQKCYGLQDCQAEIEKSLIGLPPTE